MIENPRNLADQDPEVIRQEIDATRSSITTKLEAIEEQVVGTVQNARDSVQETIDTVKDTVQETVDTVKETVQETVSTMKETLDLRLQVRRHPWPMVGGSFLAGLVTGAIFGKTQQGRQMPMERLATHTATPPLQSFREELSETREPGMLDRFRTEIDQVKGLAIGMAIGMVRDIIQDAVKERMPHLGDKVKDVIDDITTKLGGKPVQGPVLKNEESPDLGPRY